MTGGGGGPGAAGTALARFLLRHDAVVRVRIARVRGSSPREEGAEMLVAPGGMHGTIGGGQLEYMALDEARALLASGGEATRMDVPLGPEIGQCCGGRVEISLARMDEAARRAALAADDRDRAGRPTVHILGAGHVGRALAWIFAAQPVTTLLIDGRAEELDRATPLVERRLTALPEAEIRAARPGDAFLVLTHDHALDFLLAAEALARGDAAYIGMIGSATKRARFERYLREVGSPNGPAGLTCPIGAGASRDKRPEVIAAFVAAEVMGALTTPPARIGERDGTATATRAGAAAMDDPPGG